ncbi:MAG: biotin--[acetyl-CoA-carboxylase] ligase [Deferrisomatales bacterium]
MPAPLTDEVLLRLIESRGDPVSGQGLARDLGVTRAAVWKCVETLRRDGYPVESVPARGYRLAGDPRGLRPGEVLARLTTRRLGRPVRHLESVDSTNREAERWALEGAPEGALVVADHQDAGRGRLGRSWVDRKGHSLLLSLVLRPDLPAAQAPALTYVASVALAETLGRWIPRNAIEIKWPNDVLVAGGKVAGILLEMRCEAQRVDHVILGVGINVGGRPEDLPADLRAPATTVAACASSPPHRLAVLCAFLQAMEDGYERFLARGYDDLRAAWNRWFRMAGQRLRVRTAAATVEGVALGLGPSGALLLDRGDGCTEAVLAGDLESGTLRTP